MEGRWGNCAVKGRVMRILQIFPGMTNPALFDLNAIRTVIDEVNFHFNDALNEGKRLFLDGDGFFVWSHLDRFCDKLFDAALFG
jgi:hypothetical protein